MFFTPKFRPGINKRDTGLRNEGGYSDSNLVRFRSGSPEPVGGWSLRSTSSFEGAARGAHSWRSSEGEPVLGFGTANGLYAFLGGAIKDITPRLHDTVLHNAFTADAATTVTVNLPFHRLTDGQEVTFSNHQSTIGGRTINGDYTVTVLNEHQFTITAGAGSAVTTAGGGYIDFVAELPDGVTETEISGYGTRSYGSGPYSAADSSVQELTVWSLASWGTNLLANRSGYGLFEWQPFVTYNDLAYNGSFTGSADGWSLGSGWSYGSNSVSGSGGATSTALTQNVEGVMEGGRTYRITFTVSSITGSMKFRVNAGATPAYVDVGEASSPITKAGTYTRIFVAPAEIKDIVFERDAGVPVTIDDVSLKIEERAYRITTAPPIIDAMFVDPRGVVLALGTVFTDGVYKPTGVRTSDLGNNRVWVPDTDNIASEIPLNGAGGRLMAGLAASEQNIVWGDDAVISLQYTGEVGAAYAATPLGSKCGLISRHAMVEQNGFVLWMSNSRQFYFFRGIGANSLGRAEIIECPIQEDVFDNLDWTQALKCHAGINPEYSEAWFFYPDTRDGSECSRVAAVEWTSGTWMAHRLARTAWQGSGIFQNPLALSYADNVGRIYAHEKGNTANGALLEAWIETSDFDAEEGDTLLMLIGVVPDIKDQSGNMQVDVYGRNYPHEDLRLLGTHIVEPGQRRVNFRYKCRQYRIRFSWIGTGGWGRMGAYRLDLKKTGAKR